jgi:hypothetical protein
MAQFISLSLLWLLGFTPLAYAQATLENPAPGSQQSGVGLISGWKCLGTALTAAVDGGAHLPVLYGSPRGDTQGVCNDTNNGFGVLVNWNLLSSGAHTIRLYDAGVEFASATFTVQTLGGQFLTGLSKTVEVPNFPNAGQTTTLQWSEAAQNFVIAGLAPGGGDGETCTTKSGTARDAGDTATFTVTNPCQGRRLTITVQAGTSGFFVCSTLLFLVQNSTQYGYPDFDWTDASTEASVCLDLLPGVTKQTRLIVDQGIPLNLTRPFSIFYNGAEVVAFP